MSTAEMLRTGEQTAPVTDFVIANQSRVGWVVSVLGFVTLLAGIGMFTKAYSRIDAPPPKADAKTETPPEQPAATSVAHPHQDEYVFGGGGALLAAFALLGVGASMVARLPRPTLAERRTESRVAILLAGGLLGIAMMGVGALLFYQWSSSVTAAVNGKIGELVWVAGPVLGILAGAGLAFAACMPARAEERNNVLLRRIIYGANVALSGVLLILLLVIGNVFAAVRVPNKLDTTESGFYSFELSPETKQYLAKIDQPVHIYTTIPDTVPGEVGLYAKDTHRLLKALADANPGKIAVQFLSTTVNAQKIAQLKAKYPQADLNEFGILITLDEDEKRHGFIRFEELVDRNQQGTTFKGESRVVRELLFLAEGDAKPVVYFTQMAGELPITGGNRRSASNLVTALEKNNCIVKPLTVVDLKGPGKDAKPKIPDDAAIVVVADPKTPIPPELATALSAYMALPRPNGKKGKLIVMSSPQPKPGGTGVESTGLEEVLAGFSVRLSPKYLYNQPIRGQGYDMAIAGVPESFATSDNPIGIAYVGKPLPMFKARLVEAAKERNSGYDTRDLFLTVSDRGTWLEDEPPADPAAAWQELASTFIQPGETEAQARQRLLDFRNKMGFSLSPRTVAVSVSEGTTSRAVVFGSGEFFTDNTARMMDNVPIQAELFATTVDWLRDRPAVAAVANKTYNVYRPNPKPDNTRLIWLPGGLAIVVILALGAGVWTLRRT